MLVFTKSKFKLSFQNLANSHELSENFFFCIYVTVYLKNMPFQETMVPKKKSNNLVSLHLTIFLKTEKFIISNLVSVKLIK